MSWGAIKKTINSTIGTANEKSLDKMLKAFVESKTKISNVSINPVPNFTNGQQCNFSKDSVYFATVNQFKNGINIYKISGNSMSFLTTLTFSTNAASRMAVFSNNGQYLATGTYGEVPS